MNFDEFDPNDSFATLLNKTTRALSTQLQSNFTNAELDVTSEQWMILLLLWQEDGRSPYQIADIIGKDRAAITRLLDGLERRNLVVRIPDKSNGRQKLVYLTSQGKKIKDKLIPLGVANIKRAQSGLTREEIENCKAVLRKLYSNLTT